MFVRRIHRMISDNSNINEVMMYFEKDALENAVLKHKQWLFNVDVIFIIWLHGNEELEKILVYINLKHTKNTLPFLNVLVTRKNTCLYYPAYGKPCHTKNLLQCQIASQPITLVWRSIHLTSPRTKKQEFDHITE